MYDYLIIGAGLYGSVFAQRAKEAGKTVLVIDRRPHIGGNTYTECISGIWVHCYGAHIFHTNSERVWNYVNRFAVFNDYIHSPSAFYRGDIFTLPFNMNTFRQLWGDISPQEAAEIIARQRKACHISSPSNLEEQAKYMVGTDLYEKLIEGYTQKQWGRKCCELPPFLIKRIPVRFTFDDNYFDAVYQGIPVDGYTNLVSKLLTGIDLRLNTDYLKNREELRKIANRVLYTGPIDAYYDYCFGALEYRSVRFETELLDIPDFQGKSVVNYTDAEIPYTRIIEHKWFNTDNKDPAAVSHTVISREYSEEWRPGSEPYYPINDRKNDELYQKYKALSHKESDVFFGGRLGEYKYYDMDAAVEAALEKADELL